jgi:hypothetical protein
MTTELTERLEDIRKRAEKATPGPWDAVSLEIALESNEWMQGDNNTNDSIFMAAARADIPFLLDLVESIRAQTLEQAARVCDEYPQRDPAEDGSGYWAAEECAKTICALITQPPKE